MKRVLSVILLILVVSIAASAQAPDQPAQPAPPAPSTPPPPAAPGGGPAGRPGPAMHPMMVSPMLAFRTVSPQFITRFQDELNLTEDQKTKVKSALDKYDSKTSPVIGQSRETMQALQDSLYATQFDAAKAKEAAAKSVKAEEAVVAASIDLWTDFRSILTTEQNEKLCEFMQRGPGARPVMPPPPGGGGGAVPPTAPAAK